MTVLGPGSDKPHETHLHVDLQERPVERGAPSTERRAPAAPCEIVVGDFHDIAKDRDQAAALHKQYDSIVVDIWRGYGDARDDHRFQLLKRHYKGRLWGWGDYAERPVRDSFW